MIVFGGGGIAGLLQWSYLQDHATSSWRYPISWVVGLMLGVAVAVRVMLGIGMVFEDPIRRLEEAAPHISWGVEIGLFGLVLGATAGVVSSAGLRSVLRKRKSDSSQQRSAR